MERKRNLKVTYAALCVALAFVLPFLTGQIPRIGQALSPMHIPVFICGFTCGWQWGALVGFISPLLRSVLVGMPVLFPGGCAMALELAVYGLVSGFLYRALPKKNLYIYVTLLISMVCGRIVWGIARWAFAGLQGSQFTFSAFIAGAVTNAVPGIILHLLLVPAVVMALKRAKLILN